MKVLFTVHELHIHHCDSAVIHLLEQIMSTQAELATTLETVTAQIAKIGTETTALLNRIEDLTLALADAGATTPEVDAAVAALQAQAAVVDDLVPDAVP